MIFMPSWAIALFSPIERHHVGDCPKSCERQSVLVEGRVAGRHTLPIVHHDADCPRELERNARAAEIAVGVRGLIGVNVAVPAVQTRMDDGVAVGQRLFPLVVIGDDEINAHLFCGQGRF
jgi:hypothetical protein